MAISIKEHTLPPLGYSYDALEPHISAQIMELHHSKHHQTYIDNLNAAEKELAAAVSSNDVHKQIALQEAIRFNGGGHLNHSLFWKNLKSSKEGGGKLSQGGLEAGINKDFGSLDKLKDSVNKAALGIKGSGWVWLADRLIISTSKDQDPLIQDVPLFGIDMWEHAYYLQYWNKKADYLKAIWNVIDFDEATKRYQAGKSKA